MRETNARTCITSRGDRGFVVNGRRKAGALVALLLIAFAAVALHVSLSVPAALADDAAGSSLASGTIDAVGVETLETDETVESDIGLSLSPKRSAKAPVRAGNAATRVIESAHLTEFTVSADGTTPASVATVGQDLWIMLRWEVDDLSEIQNAGDYLSITLPSDLEYVPVAGSYKLNDSNAGGYAGAVVANYALSGNEFRVTFTDDGVDYLKSLEGNALAGAFEASGFGRAIFSGAHFADTSASGKALTASLNESSLQSGPVQVQDAQARKLTDVELVRAAITANGTELSTISLGDNFTVSISAALRGSSRFVVTGDYFMVSLPSELSYIPFERVSVDAAGNAIRLSVYQDVAGPVLKVEFADVVNPVNSFTVNAGLAAAWGVSGPLAPGAVSLPFSVIDGASQKIVNITVKELGDTSPETYFHRSHPAYSTGVDNCWNKTVRYQTEGSSSTTGVNLFVLANHTDDLEPYPFGYVNGGAARVDWVPEANYIDAYCAQLTANIPINATRTGVGAPYVKRPLTVNNTALSASQRQALSDILSTSFPYVSLEEMQSNLGLFYELTEREAAVATQMAIWKVTDPDATISPNLAPGENDDVIRMVAKLLTYKNPGAQQRAFLDGPEVSIVGNSAYVNGKVAVRSAYDLKHMKGVARVLPSGDEVELTFSADGTFSAHIPDVSQGDKIQVDVTYPEYRYTNAYYYDCAPRNQQNLVSADVNVVGSGTITWEYGPDAPLADIAVVKTWEDGYGQELSDMTVPVEVGLFRDGDLLAKETLTSATNYAYLWEQLPLVDKDGKRYTYTVQELSQVEGFSLADRQVDFDEESGKYTFTLVNKRDLPETVTFRVEKFWADSSSLDEPVTFTLYRKAGTGAVQKAGEVDLSRDNAWVYVWEGLERADKDGVEYAYFVEEQEVAGYTATYGDVLEVDGGYKQIVTNHQTVVLPESGGMGVIPFAVVGLALMAAAGTLIVRRRHN